MDYLFHPVAVVVVSVLIGGAVRLLKKPIWLAYVLPPALYFALGTYVDMGMPYRGGGASFWPVGEIIAAVIAFVGSAAGYFLAGYLAKKK